YWCRSSMPRAVGVSPCRFSKWPRSCSSAAVTRKSPASSPSASCAAWSACCSCETPSPLYAMWPWSRKSFSMSPNDRLMGLLGGSEVGPRLVDAGGVLQAAAAQLAGLLEDRVGGRAEEGVDAAHVADDVQVQRAGLDGLHGLAREPVQVRVMIAALEVAEAFLLHEQVLRALEIAVQEDRHAEPKVHDEPLVQLLDLLHARLGERQAVRDLLVAQVLHDALENVAHVLEVDGKRDDLGPAPAVLLLQHLLADLREVELHRGVEAIHVVVELDHLLGEHRVVGADHLQHAVEHLL